MTLKIERPAHPDNATQVFQLLGTRDDMVGPEDDIDLVTGSDFVHMDVPYTGHKDILMMDSSESGLRRASILRGVLAPEARSGSTRTRQDRAMAAANMNPESGETDATDAKDVTDAVFVVHGIRDIGQADWRDALPRKDGRRDGNG
ncbi:MAG TPA: hypothetical protein VJ385_21795 [Fibrobacteria bacterium]|nr:hypothetical protein [Fibrobacteria bacterium]